MLRVIFILTIFCSFTACSGKTETAASVAQEWCELNGKVARANTDDERRAAEARREEYEKKIEEKYKGNEAFRKEVEEEVEKCEDASEGR